MANTMTAVVRVQMDTGDEGYADDGRTERPNHAASRQGFEMAPPRWMNSCLDLVVDHGMKPNRNMPDLGHRSTERKSEVEGGSGAVVVGTLDTSLIPWMGIEGGSGACHGQTAS